MFSLICFWINGWINTREAGDLRRYRGHYDVIIMIDNKPTLVQVMPWCRQATSHYPSQCWPRSMSPYGVSRPKWFLKGFKNSHIISNHCICRKKLKCNLNQNTAIVFKWNASENIVSKKAAIVFRPLLVLRARVCFRWRDLLFNGIPHGTNIPTVIIFTVLS